MDEGKRAVRESSLSGRVFALAEGGRVVTLEQAVAKLFGPDATRQDRVRVKCAVDAHVSRGRLERPARGAFRVVQTTNAEPEELEAAPEQRRMPAVETFLNAFADWENGRHIAFHEILSELRRVLRLRQVATETEEPPSGFRITRHASTSQTVSVRRVGR